MKVRRDQRDLAVLGGPPAFDHLLHVGRPNIGDRSVLHRRIDAMLDRRWLTNHGPLVEEFEQRVAELVGARHAIATCNATAGLEVTAAALELSGEVIVPAFTFAASAHAIRWLGMTPVLCDIDPATHNLDPERAAELITPRTSAILGVHVWGRACAVDELKRLAADHGLRLLFDAAHAFACSHGGSMIGGFGDAEVFSFHATKFVNSFEGGMITTNDDALADRLRLVTNFGFETVDTVVSLGTNAKMSEASAAMGLTSLDALDDLLATNRRNFDAYREGLRGLPGITLAEPAPDESSNHQYVVLELDQARAGLSRDALLAVLHAENVFARRYFYPGCHRMEPYRSEDPTAGERLPMTTQLTERVLVLPTGTATGQDDIATICELIALALERADELQDVGRPRLHDD